MNFYAVSEVAGVASVQHDVDVLFQAVPPLCCPPMLNSSRLKGGHNELRHSLKRRGPGTVAYSVSDPTSSAAASSGRRTSRHGAQA